MRCFVPTDDQHTRMCCGGRHVKDVSGFGIKWERCGKPAKFHVNYGTGCGQFCGIHKRQISRKRAGSEVVLLACLTH